MGNAKYTNFGISGYVHATPLNFKDYTDKRTAYARTFMHIGGSGFNPRVQVMRRYREMDAEFKRITGLSSEDFMRKMGEQSSLLLTIGRLFESQSIKEIQEIMDDEQFKNFEDLDKNLQIILKAGQLAGYSNVFAQLNSDDPDPELVRAIKEMEVASSKISTFDGLVSSLDEHAHGSTKGSTKERIAMNQLLLGKVLESATDIRKLSDGTTIIGGEAMFDGTTITNFENNLKDAIDMIGGKKCSIKDIQKKQNTMKNAMNTSLKGAITGELASAAQTELLVAPIIESALDQVVEGVYMVGKEKLEMGIEIDISGTKRSGGKSKYYSKPAEFKMKNMKADVLLKTPTGDLKISRKTYNALRSYQVTQSSDQSIGSLLALSKDQATKSSLMHNDGAVMFNALASVYTGHEFSVEKGPNKAYLKKGGKISTNTEDIDRAYGGVLRHLTMVIMDGHLSTETVGLMDVNGLMIPTPIYYKEMMEKLISDSSNVFTSSHIDYKQRQGIAKMEGILESSAYDANKSSDGKYRYAGPALQRNMAMKSTILEHRVGVRSTMFDTSSYAEKYLFR